MVPVSLIVVSHFFDLLHAVVEALVGTRRIQGRDAYFGEIEVVGAEEVAFLLVGIGDHITPLFFSGGSGVLIHFGMAKAGNGEVFHTAWAGEGVHVDIGHRLLRIVNGMLGVIRRAQ